MAVIMKDALGVNVTLKSTLEGLNQIPHHKSESSIWYTQVSETWTSENDLRDLINIQWPSWARFATIHVSNGGDQAIGIRPYLFDGAGEIDSGYFEFMYEVAGDVPAGARKTYSYTEGGTGGSRYEIVPGFGRNNHPMYLRFRVTPVSSMSGTVKVLLVWSS